MTLLSFYFSLTTKSLGLCILGFEFAWAWALASDRHGGPRRRMLHLYCPFGYITITGHGLVVAKAKGRPPTYEIVYVRGKDPWAHLNRLRAA